MKPSILALLACVVITLSIVITACHKKKSSTPVSTGSPLISGLTAVKLQGSFDSVAMISKPYITWHFSGTNTITAMPDTMVYEFGYQQLSFSGSNPTLLTYTNMSNGFATNYVGLGLNIAYNLAGLIDTVSIRYADSFIGGYQAAFQYNGDQIAKIIVGRLNYPIDTFDWTEPDIFTFTYTGNNISQIQAVIASGTYSFTTTYTADTRKNNFAGSMSTFFQLEFLEQTTESIELIWTDLPQYINANLVVDSNSENITDAEGRLTEHITHTGFAQYDTVFYYY